LYYEHNIIDSRELKSPLQRSISGILMETIDQIVASLASLLFFP